MRIQLRKLTENDLYKVTSILDKETAEWAKIPYPFDREIAENFIVNYNTWGIWLNGDVLAGVIEVKEDCETAYFINPLYRNIGLATEACKLAIEYFADRQLFALINPDNAASLRVAQKANMRVKFIE